MNQNCEYCGGIHPGRICYRITAIEYFENGVIKRVEFEAPKHIHEAAAPVVISTEQKRDPFELRG